MPLKISLSSSDPLSVAADVVVIGVPEGVNPRAGALGAAPCDRAGSPRAFCGSARPDRGGRARDARSQSARRTGGAQ